MNKKNASVFAITVPTLISILIIKWYIDAWWQLIDPVSFFEGCMDCDLPAIFYLVKIILLTGMLLILWSTIIKKEWAYKTLKWLLILASIISFVFLITLVPRLWTYKKVGLNLDNWETSELTFTPKEKWECIYKPLVISLCATCFSLVFLWLWTREHIKSKFIRKTLAEIPKRIFIINS